MRLDSATIYLLLAVAAQPIACLPSGRQLPSQQHELTASSSIKLERRARGVNGIADFVRNHPAVLLAASAITGSVATVAAQFGWKKFSEQLNAKLARHRKHAALLFGGAAAGAGGITYSEYNTNDGYGKYLRKEFDAAKQQLDRFRANEKFMTCFMKR